jgi:hypothetical protein
MRGPQHLRPLEQLEPARREEPLAWTATRDDPQFLVQRGRLLPGWYMLEVSLRLEDGRASTRLYLDPGPGFDEASSIQLTVASETLSKRLFRVERRLHNLRFDPLDRPGRFSVLHFRIAWLAPFFAQDRLLRRLARHRYAAHALSPRTLRQRLRTQAAEAGRPWLALALEQYDATFARHRQPSQQVPRVSRLARRGRAPRALTAAGAQTDREAAPAATGLDPADDLQHSTAISSRLRGFSARSDLFTLAALHRRRRLDPY